jgi:hypothetical protein
MLEGRFLGDLPFFNPALEKRIETGPEESSHNHKKLKSNY